MDPGSGSLVKNQRDAIYASLGLERENWRRDFD